MPKVQVKVIGSEQPGVHLGRDRPARRLRRRGRPRPGHGRRPQGPDQYAFYRGTTSVGPPPAAPNAPAAGKPQQPAPDQADLQQNVRGQNFSNQERQLQRLEERYKGQDNGVKAKSAY